MNKSQAKKKVFDYFKKNAIEYKFVNEELKLIDVDSLDTIYLCASIPEVIGGHIETCIRFREENLYCQSYYCQPVVHNEEEAIRAARLINYLNRHLKYDCDKLYNHAYILDEDKKSKATIYVSSGSKGAYSKNRKSIWSSMCLVSS